MDASVIIWVVVAALIMWACFYLVNHYVPEPIRTVGNVLLVLLCVLVLLSFLGVVHGFMPGMRLTR